MCSSFFILGMVIVWAVIYAKTRKNRKAKLKQLQEAEQQKEAGIWTPGDKEFVA
jgi:hypothetical protein